MWLFPKPVKRKFLRCILSELINKNECMSLHNDNQSAINSASGHTEYNRTNHIDIKYHFVREAIESDVVKLLH